MFVDESFRQMREFINLSEAYSGLMEIEKEVVAEQTIAPVAETSILHADLTELLQKLRTFMEDSGGEYALGFEAGMQRAAEMLENVMDQYSRDGNIG